MFVFVDEVANHPTQIQTQTVMIKKPHDECGSSRSKVIDVMSRRREGWDRERATG